MSQQIMMVSLEDLVPTDHIYRKFSDLWKFERVEKQLKDVEKDNNYKGYGVLRLWDCYNLSLKDDFLVIKAPKE